MDRVHSSLRNVRCVCQAYAKARSAWLQRPRDALRSRQPPSRRHRPILCKFAKLGRFLHMGHMLHLTTSSTWADVGRFFRKRLRVRHRRARALCHSFFDSRGPIHSVFAKPGLPLQVWAMLVRIAVRWAVRAPALPRIARRALEPARAACHLAVGSSSRGASAARLLAALPRATVYLPPPCRLRRATPNPQPP